MHMFVFKHLRLLIVNICSELSEHQDLFFLVDTGGAEALVLRCLYWISLFKAGTWAERVHIVRVPWGLPTQATAEPASLEILGHPTCHSWPESHFPDGFKVLGGASKSGKIPTEDAAHISGNIRIWPVCNLG